MVTEKTYLKTESYADNSALGTVSSIMGFCGGAILGAGLADLTLNALGQSDSHRDYYKKGITEVAIGGTIVSAGFALCVYDAKKQ